MSRVKSFCNFSKFYLNYSFDSVVGTCYENDNGSIETFCRLSSPNRGSVFIYLHKWRYAPTNSFKKLEFVGSFTLVAELTKPCRFPRKPSHFSLLWLLLTEFPLSMTTLSRPRSNSSWIEFEKVLRRVLFLFTIYGFICKLVSTLFYLCISLQ